MQSDLTNLHHIKKETTYLCHILTTYSHEMFMQDEMCQRAVVRSLEIIGEAVKNLTQEFTSLHHEIPWKLIAGTRDKLIHGYFDVDYDLIWDTVVQDIPSLHKSISQFISDQNT
ncbi:DUF86 domain-containing protein [Methanorbis furvi]|uniref:DUF86 domain-containing protein n=1 Tax=Methanorbis furvi TaxID=3028299 RepID=A0AAE4MEA8_9EURY|nr:hypothetical protein [Methanocorpusculaceae archaeon Ag1]